MPNEAEMEWSEALTFAGWELSWDGNARSGFLCVEHGQDEAGKPACAWASVRTVELPGCNIDIDREGRIRGIETIGHRVGLHDLVEAVRWANHQMAEAAGQKGAVADGDD